MSRFEMDASKAAEVASSTLESSSGFQCLEFSTDHGMVLETLVQETLVQDFYPAQLSAELRAEPQGIVFWCGAYT